MNVFVLHLTTFVEFKIVQYLQVLESVTVKQLLKLGVNF